MLLAFIRKEINNAQYRHEWTLKLRMESHACGGIFGTLRSLIVLLKMSFSEVMNHILAF